MKILTREFYDRDTLKVAEELLGKIVVVKNENTTTDLVHRLGTDGIRGRIVETEAYTGPEDKACHARHGRTKRNEIMWGPAGYTYVYLCMGLHYLLNIVTGKEGSPAAVLIRKIEPLSEHAPKLKSYGPGNLTKYFGIDKFQNGVDVTTSDVLYIVDDGYRVDPTAIERKPRVGIDYAEEYKDKPWRFVLK